MKILFFSGVQKQKKFHIKTVAGVVEVISYCDMCIET